MKRLFLIDGNSLVNRAFYAMPFLTNFKAEPSGAVFGFANLIIKLITEEKPDEIIVAFDHARKTFRNEIFAEYKGTRKPMPEELKSQFPAIKEMLKLMGITTIESSGIEADDILGTLAKTNTDLQKIIISGDRDLLQLIDDKTEVWLTKKGVTDLQKLDEKELMNVYKIKPFQVVEMKALMGDSSDNIPGVEGIGEKTALKLIESYGDIDNLYQSIHEISGKLKEKLVNGREKAYLSRELATIKTDCGLVYEISNYKFPFSIEVYNFFKDWSFSSLIKKESLFEEIENKNDPIAIAKRTKIEKIEDVSNLKSKIKKEFAYSLEKLEFSPNSNEIFYLEPVLTMFNDTLSVEEILKELKEIFENKDILKITTSAKKDMKKLKELSVTLENFFDLEIANYLVYAGIKTNNNDIFLNEYFSEKEHLSKKIKEYGLENLLYGCEFPLTNVLCNMENNGFMIDKDYLLKLNEEYSSDLKILEKEIKEFAGEDFNINSPKQVSDVLFKKLNLSSYNNKKLSTRADILEEMIDQHPIVEKILTYRKLYKIQTTYLNVYLTICEKSGPLIHTIFNQTVTSTGRLSSTEPNLQNIPTRDDLGKKIRKLFISKFKNGKIMSADYNQIELRLMADMSGEEELINAYKRGEDIHSLTASQIFNIPIDQVSQSQRREAKAVNFGIIYGISDYGLAQNIKTSRFRAKNYIDSYFLKYPKVKEFSNQNIDFARKNGYIKTLFGRIRHIPEINSSNYNTRTFAERVAMNMPLQGSASDIIKFAMIEIDKKLKGYKSQLILQIHDELVVDVFPGEEEKVKNILLDSMENVVKLKVNLPVSINVGQTLYDCK